MNPSIGTETDDVAVAPTVAGGDARNNARDRDRDRDSSPAAELPFGSSTGGSGSGIRVLIGTSPSAAAAAAANSSSSSFPATAARSTSGVKLSANMWSADLSSGDAKDTGGGVGMLSYGAGDLTCNNTRTAGVFQEKMNSLLQQNDALRAEMSRMKQQAKAERDRTEKTEQRLLHRHQMERALRKAMQAELEEKDAILEEKDLTIRRLRTKYCVPTVDLPPPLPLRPQDVPNDVICAICFSLPLDPVLTPCEHCFCRSCLEHSMTYCCECPMDRNIIDSDTNKSLEGLARRLFEQIAVKCPNEECGWEGMVTNYEQHARRCHHITKIKRNRKNEEICKLQREVAGLKMSNEALGQVLRLESLGGGEQNYDDWRLSNLITQALLPTTIGNLGATGGRLSSDQDEDVSFPNNIDNDALSIPSDGSAYTFSSLDDLLETQPPSVADNHRYYGTSQQSSVSTATGNIFDGISLSTQPLPNEVQDDDDINTVLSEISS